MTKTLANCRADFRIYHQNLIHSFILVLFFQTSYLPVHPLELTQVDFREILQCDVRKVPIKTESSLQPPCEDFPH